MIFLLHVIVIWNQNESDINLTLRFMPIKITRLLRRYMIPSCEGENLKSVSCGEASPYEIFEKKNRER